MICSNPILVKRKDGTLAHVPCGQCRACRVNYRQEWKMRFAHELLAHDDNTWIQLSYNDLHLALQNMEYADKDGKKFSLERKEVQDWLKRFRKEIYPLKIRYFGCGEYGENLRPHYHLALFGISPDHPAFGLKVMKSKTGWWHEMPSWPHGLVWVDNKPPSLAVGSYIAKYIMKRRKGKGASEYYENLGVNPEFVCMSTNPGIGASKIDEFSDFYEWQPVYMLNGKPCKISRYMKERICKKIAERNCKTYKGRPDYQDFYDLALEKAKKHFQDLADNYNKKYGITPTRFDSCYEQWEKLGRQQERNLKRYE